jgi:predicted RNA-binding Zn-ribbon protein involved in translation (DUF1610 family)
MTEQLGTSLKGTCFRVGQIVSGVCARCGDVDVLLYDTLDDPMLLCATCSRKRSKETKRKELCDECGAQDAWRDPVSRKNEFKCAKCHAAAGTVFQNRWAGSESQPLGVRDKAKCGLEGYGTECKGEVKWRGPLNMLACNKHAGKTSANERNN